MAFPVRAAWKLAKHMVKRKAGRRIPIKVSLEITYRCNLQCTFCGIRNCQAPEMTTPETKAMMTCFARQGTVLFGFSGGEPLLREDLPELTRHAQTLNFITTIVTNGTLLNTCAQDLRGVALIVVSLDGPRHIHDHLRGEGVFDQAVAGIEAARRTGHSVGIQCIISKPLTAQAQNFEDLIALAVEYQTAIVVQPMYIDQFNSNLNLAALLPDPGDITAVVNRLEQLRLRHPKLIAQSAHELAYITGCEQRPVKCLAGKAYCTVSPDGRLRVCLYKPQSESCRERGNWSEEFSRLAIETDCSCFNSCYNRYNHFFNFDIATLRQALINMR